MTEGHSKKVSELPTVNSVSNSDVIIVNANVSGNIVTSTIPVYKFVNSAIGNVYSYSNFITYSSGNNVVAANNTTPVAYFTYDKSVYAAAELTLDTIDTSNNRSFGVVRLVSNATIANAISSIVQIGASPINVAANASVSGNTVTLSLSQAGSTANITYRYLATLFKV